MLYLSAQTPALAMMEVTANESWIQTHLNEEELSDFFEDGLAPDSDQDLMMNEFELDFNVTSVLEGWVLVLETNQLVSTF